MSVHDFPPLSPTAALEEVREYLSRLDTWRRAREPSATGDATLKFLTRQTALEQGLGSGTTTVVVGGGPSALPPQLAYLGDLTPPTSIAGLTVTGAISHFIIQFTAPTYTQGGGNAFTEVWAANYAGGPLPTFGNAVLVYTEVESVNIIAIPAQPGVTTHFWVGAVSRAGVRQIDGAGPTGGTNGVSATTGQDVSSLLTALAGEITASELHSTLGTRIDLIDAASGVPGSVNARIVASEASSLAAAQVYTDTNAFAQADGTALASRVDLYQVAVKGTALTEDPQFRAVTEHWDRGAATLTSGSVFGRGALRATGAFQTVFSRAAIAVDATRKYRVSGRFRRSSDAPAARTIYMAVQFLDSAGANIPGGGSYWYFGAAGSVPNEAWTDYTGVFGAGTISTVPGAAVAMKVGALLFYDSGGAGAAGWHEVEYLRIEDGEVERARTDATAALAVESGVRASADGALQAQYTVKVDVNGYVSGFGLASTLNNAAPTSGFVVRADSFSVSSPTGPGITPAVPFVVQTTPTTINGVSVPVGVYMDAAHVMNGTITNAKIGNAAIDDAKIANLSAAKITAGTLDAGRIGAGSITVDKLVAGTLSASWVFAGSLSAATGTFSGSLSAATGSFAGSLSAATGTLGALTVDAAGNIKLGKTVYGADTGFIVEGNGGTPRLDLGSPTSYLRWDGTNVVTTGAIITSPTISGGTVANDVTFPSITATISGSGLTTGSNSTELYRAISVSAPTGGKSPFTYAWTLGEREQYGTVNRIATIGSTGVTFGMEGKGINAIVAQAVFCLVTDANGRAYTASGSISLQWGTPVLP